MKLEICRALLESEGIRFETRNYGLCSTKTVTLQSIVNAMNKAIAQEGRGELERILTEIKAHDVANPDHGVGCACHDAHAGALRRVFESEGLYVKTGPFEDGSGVHYAASKSLQNFLTVIQYIVRNP